MHGTVQGVFFRVHTVEAAKKHGIAGFVRNLPNGKVAGEAQGEEEPLKSFLKEVERGVSIPWRARCLENNYMLMLVAAMAGAVRRSSSSTCRETGYGTAGGEGRRRGIQKGEVGR